MILLNDEKRRNKRTQGAIRARVQGHADRFMRWEEQATVYDFSESGAGLALSRPVREGTLLHLTMPLPRELRTHDFRRPEYATWALVRRCVEKANKEGERCFSIGVAFTGKEAPAAHQEHPLAEYALAGGEPVDGSWKLAGRKDGPATQPGKTDRRQSRLQIPEEVTLELMDENGWAFASEDTVTVNLSRGGASVYTQLDAEIGSFVRLSSRRRDDLRIISVVRGKYKGQAGMSRINLEFVDQAFPIDLVS